MIRWITVAEGGDPEAPFMEGLKHPDDFERQWNDRRQAKIEVEDSDSVLSILKRGADALGSQLADDYPFWPFIDFYVEGEGIQFRRTLVLADEKGHARWTDEWTDEQYGELIRARDTGVLVGDPEKIYVLRQPGIGNGVLSDLPTWAELLRVFFEVAGAYQIAATGWSRFRRKLETIGQAADVVQKYAARWQANGANANRIWDYLCSNRWRAPDLANNLGTQTEEIVDLLECLGFVEGEDGNWSLGTDPESKLLAGNAEFLLHSPQTERVWVETILRERLDHYVETGEALELDWSRLHQMPTAPAPVREPGAAQRLREAGQSARFWLSELRRRKR